MATTDRPTASAEPACECLTLAVLDVESFARGRWHRAIEELAIRLFIALSRPRSGLVRLPDLSLGRYQLKLSTVARFRAAPFQRKGRWLWLDKDEARQAVADCLVGPLARTHARRRIQEAIEYGVSRGLDRFAATAMVYAGELPTAYFNPYQTRLRARYVVRHRSCGASTACS